MNPIKKCTIEVINNESVVIPNCSSVVNSLDIRDCICHIDENALILEYVKGLL